MFRRKIESYLKEWKSDENKMPLIIKECANYYCNIASLEECQEP